MYRSISLLVVTASLLAQNVSDTRSLLKVDLAKDAPVALVAADWGESNVSPRGGAMVVDLHSSLSLRNSSAQRIRGVTLLVLAQELTPGGKASVAVPSLDIAPGDTFPVRIDLRLLRPLVRGNAALVTVSLDGVLFDDLGFYGPNKLNSRRSLTSWELEARRDRKHFQGVLAARGGDGLRREMIESLARQADRPRLDVQMARGRATATEAGREVQFAFLKAPDAPVELVGGSAMVGAGEVSAPKIDIRNNSGRAVRHLEVAWVLRDADGNEYLAGSLPANVTLGPGEKSQMSEAAILKLARPQNQPFSVNGMSGFLTSVEYADGGVWVAGRDARMSKLRVASPEEQRLSDLYRRKGLAALTEELKKF